jgi:hypothetical protein
MGDLAGPRGQPQTPQQLRGGISPITIALLGVLAYKAFKSKGMTGGNQPAPEMGDTGTGGLGGLLGSLFTHSPIPSQPSSLRSRLRSARCMASNLS